MNLTAENVRNVLQSCLFKDGENTSNHTIVLHMFDIGIASTQP